ncbi:MAG: DUF2255 family protein [Myxococcota bacterium]
MSLSHLASMGAARFAALTSLSTALAVLVAVGASAVVPGIDWSAYADARTVVVLHTDEDGRRRETTIWLGISEGRGYVRGGGGRWVGNTRRNRDVALRIGDVELAVHATPVTDAAELERVTAAFRAKYGFGDVLATLVRGRPTIFRLEAR